jgi:hypothetical protein
MFELTEEQRHELRQATGGEVRLRDLEAQHEYVIVPAELYDRLKQMLYDASDWLPEEHLRLLAESGTRAGWDGPGSQCRRFRI